MAEEYSSFYMPPPDYGSVDYGSSDTWGASDQSYTDTPNAAQYELAYGQGGPSMGTYGQPAERVPTAEDYAQGGPSMGTYGQPDSGNWLSQLWSSFSGGGQGQV